jgi:hypothetical protein
MDAAAIKKRVLDFPVTRLLTEEEAVHRQKLLKWGLENNIINQEFHDEALEFIDANENQGTREKPY